MGSRIVASVILVAGIGALVWVGVGANSSDTTSVRAIAVAPDAAENDAAEEQMSEQSGADDTNPPDRAAEGAATDDANPDDLTSTEAAATEQAATPTPTIEAPENLGPRMDLVNIDGWLNTNATSIDDFNGKVILVEMWTFGCNNCKARIPFNQSYYEEFAGESFEIVGVHAPEFSYEADVANIEKALVDLGVTWPVALDTEKKNFRAWQPGSTNFWPRTFVIDQNGDVRYDHIGEGKYEELRETLRYLVENPPAPTTAQ